MKKTKYPRVPTDDFQEFVKIVRRLRAECPWDREQTHQSIRHSLIEEAYETVEALDENNLDELKKELGDLLLHVVMHATMAEQAKEFSLKEVIGEITDKLIRRHPHVFVRRSTTPYGIVDRLVETPHGGNEKLDDAHAVKKNWEKLKMLEGRTSILDGVPKQLPALQRALRVQERAAKVGFDWKHEKDVWEKVREEVEEFKQALKKKKRKKKEEEFGDFLFALVNYARFIGVEPEGALRGTVEKFTRRFQYIERELKRKGKDVHDSNLEEMDGLWNEAKKNHV